MNYQQLTQFTSCVLCSAMIATTLAVFPASATELQDVINVAHELDPALKQSKLKQTALEHESNAKSYWQDPRVSLSLANLPIESFSLDQEPMTQVVLGVTQMLPRGKSLTLKREQLLELSKVEESVREQRKAASKRDISILWLDALREQEKIKIIEKSRRFFEQLSELSSASYISTRGRTRQQHLIRTELEIMKLDEKLQRFSQNRDRYIQNLRVWLLSDEAADGGLDVGGFENPQLLLDAGIATLSQSSVKEVVSSTWLLSDEPVDGELEIGILENPQLLLDAGIATLNQSSVQKIISQHPEVKSVEQTMRSAQKKIAMSREVAKAAWGVNAKYGYREGEREEFFSLGVSVDVPINRNKQNRQVVSAATQHYASIKQKRWGVQRKLQSNFQQYLSQIKHLKNRQEHYQKYILSQIRVEAESAQNAYISDEGDFREVIRALIGEVSAQLEELDIDIERQKYIAKLEYLLIGKVS